MEKSAAPEQMQVQKSAEPAKVVGFSYVAQSALYDGIRILSIVPAKVVCTGIRDLILSQKEALGEGLIGYAAAIFKTSLKTEDLLLGVAARTFGFYFIKTYAPYSHPLSALEKITGTKTFLHTPEQNLREGRLGEYAVQRLLYTGSTNVVAAVAVIATKIVLIGMAVPATAPAFCAAFASTYCAILAARTMADVIQDVLGVAELNPDRKKLLSSLEQARERAAQRGMPSGGAMAHG